MSKLLPAIIISPGDISRNLYWLSGLHANGHEKDDALNILRFAIETDLSHIRELGSYHKRRDPEIIEPRTPFPIDIAEQFLKALESGHTSEIPSALCHIASNRPLVELLSRNNDVRSFFLHSKDLCEELAALAPPKLTDWKNDLPEPQLSRSLVWTAARMTYDLGTKATTALQEDPSGKLYETAFVNLALGLLNLVNWQPLIRHGERLEEIKSLQEQGVEIFFVVNHRSFFDIAVMEVLVQGLSPRHIAKGSLRQTVPVIGWTPRHHLSEPHRWVEDGIADGAQHITFGRGDAFGFKEMRAKVVRALNAGHSIVGYPEGHRSKTPDRSHEVGMLPFQGGTFRAITMECERQIRAKSPKTRKIAVVPISLYGTGMIGRVDFLSLLQGLQMNVGVVASIGQPHIIDPDTLKRSAGWKRTGAVNLMHRTFNDLWRDLAITQAAMYRG